MSDEMARRSGHSHPGEALSSIKIVALTGPLVASSIVIMFNIYTELQNYSPVDLLLNSIPSHIAVFIFWYLCTILPAALLGCAVAIEVYFYRRFTLGYCVILNIIVVGIFIASLVEKWHPSLHDGQPYFDLWLAGTLAIVSLKSMQDFLLASAILFAASYVSWRAVNKMLQTK